MRVGATQVGRGYVPLPMELVDGGKTNTSKHVVVDLLGSLLCPVWVVSTLTTQQHPRHE